MELISKYHSVILFTDYMFLNSVPFFNTYSCNISFITSLQQKLKTDQTIQSIKPIEVYYAKRGFEIVELKADKWFKPDQAALADIQI